MKTESNLPKKTVVAIIDGYSSANQLPSACLRQGYQSIHICSSKDLPSFYFASYQPDEYVSNFIYGGSDCELEKQISKFNIVAVIPGVETGVELADKLSEKLGLITNGTLLSESRRDKLLMAKAVASAGVRVPDFYRANSKEMAKTWWNKCNYKEIVVKPPRSGGTDNVFICSNKSDIDNALEKILGLENKLGELNEFALLQECIDGQEYVVNTISTDGEHRIVDLIKYTKIRVDGAGRMYDYGEHLELELVDKRIFPYVCKVLDALGIRHGPAHTEMMIDKSGPVLIETGARIGGAQHALLSRKYGFSQVDLCISSFLGSIKNVRSPEDIYSNKSACIFEIELVSSSEGVVTTLDKIKEIQSLESAEFVQVKVSIGDNYHVTKDLFTSPGWILLAHTNRNIVVSDYNRIRELEFSGLFVE